MKKEFPLIIAATLVSVVIWGCSKDKSPVSPPLGRTFSGITPRNEFGDTTGLIDPTDWVIQGVGSTGLGEMPELLPTYRNGVHLSEDRIYTSGVQIGAFPNPFIPGAGHLLIKLVLPNPLHATIYIVNASGQDSIVLVDQQLSQGYYTFLWEGRDSQGNRLPDDIYRVFFDGGNVHSFGDVQTTLSNPPDPDTFSAYIGYANNFYDTLDYYNWEWQRAVNFGPSGQLNGPNRFGGSLETWMTMTYPQKFLYLPVFFNYDPRSCSSYQYYYLLADKNFQMGAGWPAAGNYGEADSTEAWWQLNNYYHDDYLTSFQGGP